MSLASSTETVEDKAVEDIGLQECKSAVTSPSEGVNWWLLLLYSGLTAVGAIGGPLLQRLYYMHGGNRKWLSSWLLSAGFLVMLPPLSFLFLKHLANKNSSLKLFFMDNKLLYSSAFIGILLGLDNYMYSAGLSYIPVSTSSLLFSTQLSFTAVFAFFIVKQKFIFHTINSVVVMTFGAVVLALHTSSDRPPGVSEAKYLLGFIFTLGGAFLYGLSLPLIEFAYSKSRKPLNYLTVFQFQFVMNLLATLFCTVGMLANKDFKVIPREAREFAIGERKYYMILVASAICWQFAFLGTIGVISCTSSLCAGILTSVLLPLTELAAIVIFHEKFTAEKGMSLALCLWGFASYFIGEYKKNVETKSMDEVTKDERSDLECSERWILLEVTVNSDCDV